MLVRKRVSGNNLQLEFLVITRFCKRIAMSADTFMAQYNIFWSLPST